MDKQEVKELKELVKIQAEQIKSQQEFIKLQQIFMSTQIPPKMTITSGSTEPIYWAGGR